MNIYLNVKCTLIIINVLTFKMSSIHTNNHVAIYTQVLRRHLKICGSRYPAFPYCSMLFRYFSDTLHPIIIMSCNEIQTEHNTLDLMSLC